LCTSGTRTSVTTGMDFRVLGPFEVRRDGVSIDLRGSKRRALLALLVIHANEVVRNERLIEDLWGEEQLADALAALRNHVSRLRKRVGSDVLVTKPWGYVLRVAPDQIDLTLFEQLVAEARPLPARERAAKLQEALNLWRGPALADLGNEPALELDISRLEELRLGALEQRIDADLELGRHEQLIGELEALVAEQPLRERLRGQLILALYRSGRQAEALETYRETRRLLVNELGIEPTSELRELERAILRQDESLAGSSPAAPEDSELRPRWRWPRSPLVAGGALLLVGALIAIAALLHDDNGGAPAAAKAAAHTRVTPTSSTQAHPTPTPAPAPAPARQRPAPTAPRHAKTFHPRRATTEQRPRETKHPTRAHVAHTSTISRAARAKVYWLKDAFEDPAVNYGMWHIASHGSGVESVERNGRLEFTVAANAVAVPTYGFDQHYGTNCHLIGNFDARVDYQLLTWPTGNGTYLTFGVYFPPDNGFWNIARQGAPANGGSEAYAAVVGSSNLVVPTADTSGSLRLRRHGSMLSEYYRHGNGWVKMRSRATNGPVQLLLGLFSNADQFGAVATTAAFDNFQATADRVDCPGVPLPPLKPHP
jgi:DNA-binding SARP family transcriptional activator